MDDPDNTPSSASWWHHELRARISTTAGTSNLWMELDEQDLVEANELLENGLLIKYQTTDRQRILYQTKAPSPIHLVWSHACTCEDFETHFSDNYMVRDTSSDVRCDANPVSK